MITIATAATAFVAPMNSAVSTRGLNNARMAEKVEMDQTVLDKYMSLPVTGKVQAEYIFIDNDGDVRSKCRTVDANKASLDQLPSWNYDGSSTDQAPGEDSEVLIKPRIAPGEATFHKVTNHISRTVLESVGQLPSNMRLEYRPLPELLSQARLMATVSSTAFFDALDFGCRPLALADFGLNPANGSHVFAGSGVWRSLDAATDLDSLDQELPQPDKDWLTWMGYGQTWTPEDLILALQELKRNKRQEIKLERGYMSNTNLSFTQLRRDAERAIQDKQWQEAHILLTLARVMRPSHRNVARRLKAVEQPNQLLRRLLLVMTRRDVG